MRILQICLKPPYPKVDGGCIAMASTTESMLMGGHSVKTLCMSTHKHPFDISLVPDKIRQATDIEAIEIDTRIKPLDALINLFSSNSYNIERFFSEKFENRLTQILNENEFDIIHLESIFCTPYLDEIRRLSNAKVVLRAHNVEFKIWEQLSNTESNPLKKWYLSVLAFRLKCYELEVLKQFDGVLAITPEDKGLFENLGISCPVEVAPIGINTRQIRPSAIHSELKFYHVGAMDWEPNIEGITWFLDAIWPKIEEHFPKLECHLAGRKMPKYLLNRSCGKLTIQGEITSVEQFVADKPIAIIPLISGSGMRVKLVEALALGKVIITTSIGAAGIPFKNGKNLLIADTPEEFIQQTQLLADKPELITEISLNARKLAEEAFDIANVSSKLSYFYQNL